MRNIGRLELLKENVDGEALNWAVGRLRARPELNKVLFVISDGAPMDDATALANDVDFLWRHLQSKTAEIENAKDVRLAGIGLDYALSELYPRSIVMRTPDDVAHRLIPFVADHLFPNDGQLSESNQG